MFAQFIIASTEVTAMLLLSSKNPDWRKYAAFFGLMGQPFWFYSTFTAHQYGAFFLCFIFTGIWIKVMCEEYFMEQREIPPKGKIRSTNEEYYGIIMDELHKIKNNEQTYVDHYDYIEKLLREALLEK